MRLRRDAQKTRAPLLGVSCMEIEESQSAVNWLESWFLEQQSFLESLGLTVQWNKSDFGSAVVNVDSEKVASNITAWNHGSTLEIMLTDLSTNLPTLIFDGACPSKKTFVLELENYSLWLKEKHEFSN